MVKRKRNHGQNAEPSDPSAIDPAASKLKFNSYEDIADSEDDFHINRDKVSLGQGADVKRARQGGFEAEELSDEEVLGYSDSASDEADEVDADGDSTRASEDSKSEEEEEEEDEIGGWGSSKADYYNADKIETEQDALDEEAEARRIQQKRLRALKEADFGFDENQWIESGKKDGETQEGGVVTEVLPQIQVTDEMGPTERLKLLKARYPEFEPLSKEMVDLHPVHEQLSKELKDQQSRQNGELLGFSALELKFNALSGYLGALAMYFAFLTSTAAEDGSSPLPMAPSELQEHEIMDTLVRCRNIWETIKDLPTFEPPESPGDGARDSMFIGAEVIQQDPEPTSNAEQAAKSTTKQTSRSRQDKAISASEARRAARLRRTEESLAALTASISQKQQARSKNLTSTTPTPSSSITRHQRGSDESDSDLGDEPVDAAQSSTGPRKKSLKFYTSQLAQKANKRANAGRNVGGDEDLPHRERLRDRQERLNLEAERRAKKGRGQGLGADLDGEEDGDGEETNREREARMEDDVDEEPERALEERMLAKKAEKASRRRDAAGQGANADRHRPLAQLMADADGRREVGYVIEKNKGLTPRRKKEVRNPRVKKRMRYEDKSKKLRSMKATYKGGEGRGGYGGELTGIKKGLVRSVKL